MRARDWVLGGLLCGALSGCSASWSLPVSPAHCELPQIGSPQIVHQVSTGLPARYTLEQLSERELRATVYITFEEAGGGKAWEDTQSCLEQASPFFKGPQGEKLKIVLARPHEALNSPLSTVVQMVDDPARRGHMRLWQQEWGCPERVHEVLHLVGLVDKYEEIQHSGPAAIPGTHAAVGETVYPCRAPGPEDSLMRDPRAAYQAVWRGERNSLLYPGEFNAIAYPGCHRRNETYYNCAMGAYRQSAETCESIPDECRNGDWVRR